VALRCGLGQVDVEAGASEEQQLRARCAYPACDQQTADVVEPVEAGEGPGAVGGLCVADGADDRAVGLPALALVQCHDVDLVLLSAGGVVHDGAADFADGAAEGACRGVAARQRRRSRKLLPVRRRP
jgi:hypothetical protein